VAEVMSAGDTPVEGSDLQRPSHLRLIWKNPLPPVPRAPVDLAAAIERHLAGGYGLSDQEFLRQFSRRELVDRPAWADAAAIV
jgi:hypothetical protein